MTARTAPPAMTPVPVEAGRSRTCPAPKRPTMGCGIVPSLIGTRLRFRLARSTPLAMAIGTSRAFPMPNPTCPWESPTTTSAEKRKFLPPLTTLVTRLMWTTWSFRSRSSGLILLNVCSSAAPARPSELESGRARRLGHRLDPTVIQVAAAVEDRAVEAFLLETLGDQGADLLGRLDVAVGLAARLPELERRRVRHRLADGVVDRLHVDVVQAAEDAEPRTHGVPGDTGAHPLVAARPRS